MSSQNGAQMVLECLKIVLKMQNFVGLCPWTPLRRACRYWSTLWWFLMGGPISAVFSDICVCKMKSDVAVFIKSWLYKRYVDDTFICKRKITIDVLFRELDTHYQNIKLTSEVNPSKLLYTRPVRDNRLH